MGGALQRNSTGQIVRCGAGGDLIRGPCVETCVCGNDATSDGGKTPFDWGDVCTWMINAVYGGGANGYGCRYVMETENGGTGNPQGVIVDVIPNGDGTWDVEARAATNALIYEARGLPANTFTCVGGVLSGAATLSPAEACAGSPNVTFTIGELGI